MRSPYQCDYHDNDNENQWYCCCRHRKKTLIVVIIIVVVVVVVVIIIIIVIITAVIYYSHYLTILCQIHFSSFSSFFLTSLLSPCHPMIWFIDSSTPGKPLADLGGLVFYCRKFEGKRRDVFTWCFFVGRNWDKSTIDTSVCQCFMERPLVWKVILMLSRLSCVTWRTVFFKRWELKEDVLQKLAMSKTMVSNIS